MIVNGPAVRKYYVIIDATEHESDLALVAPIVSTMAYACIDFYVSGTVPKVRCFRFVARRARSCVADKSGPRAALEVDAEC